MANSLGQGAYELFNLERHQGFSTQASVCSTVKGQNQELQFTFGDAQSRAVSAAVSDSASDSALGSVAATFYETSDTGRVRQLSNSSYAGSKTGSLKEGIAYRTLHEHSMSVLLSSVIITSACCQVQTVCKLASLASSAQTSSTLGRLPGGCTTAMLSTDTRCQ